MSELSICSEEVSVLGMSESLDVSVQVINYEGFDCVVELVLVQVSGCVLQKVVRPVGMLFTVEVSVVVGNPQSVLHYF